MMFSVLICTYNRHELLRGALRSLVEGTAEKPDEIIVVNGGDEQADEVVRSFTASSVEVRLIKTVNRNLAVSRNIGLPQCRGDIIAMTDDDAEVFPDWVTRMKAAHEVRPDAGAVGGPVLGTNSHSLVGKVADAVTFPFSPTAADVRTLPGVNISYKREVVRRIGVQDETLFRGEDVDYNWRVLQLGYKIHYDPAIKVYHHHRPTLKGFLNQHYMYGRAYYLVRRKWESMYCVYPHRIRRFRDVLKAGNFVAGMFYDPFLACRRVPAVRDRIAALPLLFGCEVVWKAGMIAQAYREHKAAAKPIVEAGVAGLADPN